MRLKEFRDRCVSTGRFVLGPQVLGPVAARALLLLAVAALASSTLMDPLQRFTQSGMTAAVLAGNDADFTSLRQRERLALLRRIAADADAVRRLSGAELILLFGPPGLRRAEPEAESWHYTTAECALDVYFPRAARHPVYAEYRLRGQAEESGLVEPGHGADHRVCLRALFAQAKPDDADADAPPPAF